MTKKIMNIMKITIVILFFVAFAMPTFTHAQTRSIYLQDILVLDLEGNSLTTGAIEKAFLDFDIEAIEKTDTGYEITVRPKAPGTYEVLLGDQPLTIEVASALEDLGRDTIFDKELTLNNHTGFYYVSGLLVISLLIWLISSVVLLVRFGRKFRRSNSLTPIEEALASLNMLNLENSNILGQMTSILKVYLSDVIGEKLVGMTSKELLNSLGDTSTSPSFQLSKSTLNEMTRWLEVIDGVKYRPGIIPIDEVSKHREVLANILKEIDRAYLEHKQLNKTASKKMMKTDLSKEEEVNGYEI